MSVYLFTKRYAEEEMYRPHPAFYRPRLSDCSDYSGQFLQPEAWRRGRSPSDISSDVSIQMTQNYRPPTNPIPGLGMCPCLREVLSDLENPRDGRAWWAPVYGVAQSQTRLKRLSSIRQPWALSLPDKELCLREALAVCTPPAPEPSAKRPGS